MCDAWCVNFTADNYLLFKELKASYKRKLHDLLCLCKVCRSMFVFNEVTQPIHELLIRFSKLVRRPKVLPSLHKFQFYIGISASQIRK